MSQFSAAVTALQSESKFAKAYADGVPKTQYWEVREGGMPVREGDQGGRETREGGRETSERGMPVRETIFEWDNKLLLLFEIVIAPTIVKSSLLDLFKRVL